MICIERANETRTLARDKLAAMAVPDSARMEIVLAVLAIELTLAGCYRAHERGREPGRGSDAATNRDVSPRADAGGACTTPGAYRPAELPPGGAPTLRARHASVAASSFRFVATPTGFVAAVDENEDDTGVIATTLLGFDREGTLLWRRAFAEPISDPIVDAAGTIWTARRGGVLVSLEARGNVTAEHLIVEPHSALWLSSMDSRGRLILTMPEFPTGAGIVASFDPCAGELWRLGLASVPIAGPAEDLAGRLYFVTSEHVYVVGIDGDWQATHAIGSFINGHPTRLESGEIAVTSVVGTGVDDASSATRVSLVSGETVRTLEVPGRWHPGRDTLAEGGGGALLVRRWTDVALVDLASGAEAWRRFAHPNIAYEAWSGPGGDLLVLSHTLSLLDAATGEPRWALEPPTGTSCVDGVALDGPVLAASQCDGSYFVAGW